MNKKYNIFVYSFNTFPYFGSTALQKPSRKTIRKPFRTAVRVSPVSCMVLFGDSVAKWLAKGFAKGLAPMTPHMANRLASKIWKHIKVNR